MSENNSAQRVRLNKLIADSGLASRRHADRMIEEGQVTVNGKRVYELGIKVDPTADRIMIDGKPLRKPLSQKYYLVFNKPKGVLTTMDDPHGRPTVADYLGEVPARVFPVGRLDWDSEGMLLLTNDGDFANKVMHPKAEVTKTYLVKLDGQPQPHQIEKLKKGVSIVGGRVSARHIEKIKKSGDNKSDKYEWYKIVITEGKNRQIRQMFAKVGFDVLKLQRVAIGRLRMGALKAGELIFLNEVAVERVFLADDPEEVKQKRTYKGRTASVKKTAKPASRIRVKKESKGK
ncbi:pseudouridylate synthase [Bdellovibrio bacteriovorus]|uniref:Pseudouridylate synthase n=1 Tax=Bdellovibrio bacteriovorus TaxID=959 RepID=A0A162GKD4_BDEBC|nr:pseudouridine synthase [Bdellovibrio bacteriovorus]KYG68367.1 pseudouridylate synthase [Bdellovibrio bacteriovorus]